MKTIKIWFTDFTSDFNIKDNDFLKILEERYNVVVTKRDPDYLFYSNFGRDYLKYNCIRIFYTGECITPDFNLTDYALAFDRLDFGDRYLRLPLYRLFQYKKNYNKLFERTSISEIDSDKDFCSFVCSNCFADDIRAKMYEELSKYKKVNSGGRYLNNVGGPIADKLAFQSKHKFAIAFENGSYDGYATEKLVDALAAGAIPIYYGDPNIHLDFNEDSFINGHRYSSLEDIVQRVKEIDSNDDLYLRMRNESPVIKDMRGNEDLREFMFDIFDQDMKKAKRRPTSSYSRELELFYKRFALIEDSVVFTFRRIRKQFYRLTHNAR